MINYIPVTAENLAEARDLCRAVDQAAELVPGAETWSIRCSGGQRGQMSRWPNGRGAVSLGGDSLWGDWLTVSEADAQLAWLKGETVLQLDGDRRWVTEDGWIVDPATG